MCIYSPNMFIHRIHSASIQRIVRLIIDIDIVVENVCITFSVRSILFCVMGAIQLFLNLETGEYEKVSGIQIMGTVSVFVKSLSVSMKTGIRCRFNAKALHSHFHLICLHRTIAIIPTSSAWLILFYFLELWFIWYIYTCILNTAQ